MLSNNSVASLKENSPQPQQQLEVESKLDKEEQTEESLNSSLSSRKQQKNTRFLYAVQFEQDEKKSSAQHHFNNTMSINKRRRLLANPSDFSSGAEDGEEVTRPKFAESEPDEAAEFIETAKSTTTTTTTTSTKPTTASTAQHRRIKSETDRLLEDVGEDFLTTELPPRSSRMKHINYSDAHVRLIGETDTEVMEESRRRQNRSNNHLNSSGNKRRSLPPHPRQSQQQPTTAPPIRPSRTLPSRSTRYAGTLIDADTVWPESDEDFIDYPSRTRNSSANRRSTNTAPATAAATTAKTATKGYSLRSTDSQHHETDDRRHHIPSDEDEHGPILRRSSRHRVDDKQQLSNHDGSAVKTDRFASVDMMAVDEEEEDDHHLSDTGRGGYSLRPRASKVKRLVRYTDEPEPQSNFKMDDSRKYQLRPRNEPKNYLVRVPLYGASPKKTEQRRRNNGNGGAHGQRRFPPGSGFAFGLSSANRFNNMMGFPGANIGYDDSDEEKAARETVFRPHSSMSADIRPINQSIFNKDLSEKVILNQAAAQSGGQTLTDSDPVSIENNIDFSSVGGLSHHIKSLKEMVLLPLLYPEVFGRFGIVPPRGVIFHGPPGTGKTLVARALANVCSSESQKIAFFMRKGADVLSKWVGESERQLKALFEQAKLMQPAIIFFDEIDGLAPVRSAKQDQIHSSIVTTLLALMDGLDSRGQVIVIGATNRLDAIDPALRRPGRFDREFLFPLPDTESRKQIIDIHTKKWEPPLEEDLKQFLAEATQGYGGSDIKALVTEAALRSLDRTYPHVYDSTQKLKIDFADLIVTRKDFEHCLKNLVPSSYRWKDAVAKSLPDYLEPLLGEHVANVGNHLRRCYPSLFHALESSYLSTNSVPPYKPRLLLLSQVGNGLGHLTSAIISTFEKVPIHALTLTVLLQDPSLSQEAAIVRFLQEARRSLPAVIYIPNIAFFWHSIGDGVRKLIWQFLEYQLQPNDNLLLLASAENGFSEEEDVYDALNRFFPRNSYEIGLPSEKQIRLFFEKLFGAVYEFGATPLWYDRETMSFKYDVQKCTKILFPKTIAKDSSAKCDDDQQPKTLELAPAPLPKKHTKKEIRVLLEHDLGVFRRLRMTLRDFVVDLLRCKDYKSLTKGINSVEDYADFIDQDLNDILDKVEQMNYQTLDQFRKDVLSSMNSFGGLVSARGELYKISNVYAICDLVEEWILGINRVFIDQLKQSHDRWRRMKSDYEMLLRSDSRVKPFEFTFMKQSTVRQQHPSSVEDPNNFQEHPQQDDNRARVSRRLRGDQPDFVGLEAVQSIIRKSRSISPQRIPTEINSSIDGAVKNGGYNVEPSDSLVHEEVVAVDKQKEHAPGADMEPVTIPDETDPVAVASDEPQVIEEPVVESADADVLIHAEQPPQIDSNNVEPIDEDIQQNEEATIDEAMCEPVGEKPASENDVIMEQQDNNAITTTENEKSSSIETVAWLKPCSELEWNHLLDEVTCKFTNSTIGQLEAARSNFLREICAWKEQTVIPQLKQEIQQVVGLQQETQDNDAATDFTVVVQPFTSMIYVASSLKDIINQI